MKLIFVAPGLACASLAAAGDKPAYPNENVAQVVLEKLDVTSVPSAFRPKKEKGKRTFADYGFKAQKVEEKNAIIETAGGLKRLVIKVSSTGDSYGGD